MPDDGASSEASDACKACKTPYMHSPAAASANKTSSKMRKLKIFSTNDSKKSNKYANIKPAAKPMNTPATSAGLAPRNKFLRPSATVNASQSTERAESANTAPSKKPVPEQYTYL